MKKIGSVICLFIFFGCASKQIDSTVIKKQIQNKRHEFMDCYKVQYKKDSQLSGKLLLKWNINDQGQAENIHPYDSTIENEELINCVKDIISKTQFPSAPEGETVKVNYPWIFSKDSLSD